MALLDAYATAAEYRSRVDMGDDDSDAEILNQLKGVSRTLDFELSLAAGTFNTTAANVVRYFTPILEDGTAVRLVDERGMQHCINTIADDGIAVDIDGDGTYDYTIDPTGEAWVVARPYNSVELGEPFDSLELIPTIGTPSFTTWPTYPRSLKVTGTWGWLAVPNMIKDLTVKMTRDIRDSQEAGAAGVLGGQAVKTDTWRLWLTAKSMYGRRYVVVA